MQACGWGVFPGVGFMVMGPGYLCRRLVMARGGLAGRAPASKEGEGRADRLKFTAVDRASAESRLKLVVMFSKSFL